MDGLRDCVALTGVVLANQTLCQLDSECLRRPLSITGTGWLEVLQEDEGVCSTAVHQKPKDVSVMSTDMCHNH